MLYRIVEQVGDVTNEKEYEGTPREIAELINLTSQSEVEAPDHKLHFTVKVPEIPDLAEKLTQQMKRANLKGCVKK